MPSSTLDAASGSAGAAITDAAWPRMAVSRLKRLGERLSARDPTRQVAEVQIRCATLNTVNALACPTPSFVPYQSTKGRSALSA